LTSIIALKAFTASYISHAYKKEKKNQKEVEEIHDKPFKRSASRVLAAIYPWKRQVSIKRMQRFVKEVSSFSLARMDKAFTEDQESILPDKPAILRVDQFWTANSFRKR
jgi:mannose-1-phosphate guanylyltransferase